MLVLAGAVSGASAQERKRPGQAPTVSHPVVQPLPAEDSLKLNAALSRLGRNPRDLDALVDAGNAALVMGDADAATGFFRRADEVSGNDPRVKAGLAGALVRNGKPLEAIPLFDQAELAGAKPADIASDRGLAYDLVGDNATAQRLYRAALASGADEEVTQRLAISLAISGDRQGSDAVLMPLLRQQSKPAWRTRTFALAILGDTDDAVRTARTILPQNLAESMSPYLRYMPQLTRAQQAAAADLGDFPRASEIGQEDPRYARYVAASAPAVAVAKAPAQPAATSRSRKAQQSRRAPPRKGIERIAPPEPQPARESVAMESTPARRMSGPVVASESSSVPRLAEIAEGQTARSSASAAPRAASASGELPALPSSKPAVRTAAAAPTPASTPAPASAPVTRAAVATARPATAPARTASNPAAASPPTEAAAAALDSPAARISLAEAFSDLGKPSKAVAPAAGAVDISSITPARPKPEPKPEPPKPAPPSHPSRIWVQLGIGQEKDALAYDWGKLTHKASALFKGKKPFVSDMGQTNRMLVGPFDSEAQANKFVADLEDAGIDGPYIWTSPAGQVVDALPLAK